MADDKTKRGKSDRIRIARKEPYELDYEAKKLGITIPRLKQAVKAAGPMRVDVEEWLKRWGKKPRPR